MVAWVRSWFVCGMVFLGCRSTVALRVDDGYAGPLIVAYTGVTDGAFDHELVEGVIARKGAPPKGVGVSVKTDRGEVLQVRWLETFLMGPVAPGGTCQLHGFAMYVGGRGDASSERAEIRRHKQEVFRRICGPA